MAKKQKPAYITLNVTDEERELILEALTDYKKWFEGESKAQECIKLWKQIKEA